MTIEELKAAVGKAEAEIAGILEELADSTGVSINDIDLLVNEIGGIGGGSKHLISAEIILRIW